ncbi:hypothetical protein [Quadrisphaera sp. DSM 44207]|uniref:hypothetical protein n=1 Tax=Quadrisphaera sp. DSM 44207 TaxID=1881057 RepID=UPI000888F3CF|nr:hypothetical protein [Quadrisphaera sp. DSM 44207]SDQ10679.1 hypothetical protein SAMN05428996_0559 [Quadrisphaera sp. DSM 44207]
MRTLLLAGAALLGLQVLFLGLLVAGQAVPNGPVIAQLARAVDSGEYGAPYAPDGLGGTADRFTECVVLGYGVSSPDDPRSLWHLATGGPRLSSCEDGAAQIRALAAGEALHAEASYFRYWSGYSVLTRPVLALLGVTGLRTVVAGLLVVAVLWAHTALSRRLGRAPALALVLPLAVGSNAVALPSTAFTHGIALAAVAAGVAGTAVLASRGWASGAAGAGLAAAVFNDVDLLTVPATSWAMCAAVAGAVVHARGARLPAVLGAVAAAGAAWPVAYGVTWVSRWVVAALVQGPGVFARVAEVGRFRLDGQFGTLVEDAAGAPTRANLRTWLDTVPTAGLVIAVALGVAVTALVVAVRRHGWRGLALAAALAAPALVVPAWYEVMSNHSQIHAFFTYRSLPAATGVVVLACLVAAARVRPAPTGRRAAAARRIELPTELPDARAAASVPSQASR